MGDERDKRTLWCGNLDEKVTEALLYELFLQAGPLDQVVHKNNYAFIIFEHEESALYTKVLYDGLTLFGKAINLKFRNSYQPDIDPYEQIMDNYYRSLSQTNSDRMTSGRRRDHDRRPYRRNSSPPRGSRQQYDSPSTINVGGQQSNRKIYNSGSSTHSNRSYHDSPIIINSGPHSSRQHYDSSNSGSRNNRQFDSGNNNHQSYESPDLRNNVRNSRQNFNSPNFVNNNISPRNNRPNFNSPNFQQQRPPISSFQTSKPYYASNNSSKFNRH